MNTSGVVDGGTIFQMRSSGKEALSEKNSVPNSPIHTGPSTKAKKSPWAAPVATTSPLPSTGSPIVTPLGQTAAAEAPPPGGGVWSPSSEPSLLVVGSPVVDPSAPVDVVVVPPL